MAAALNIDGGAAVSRLSPVTSKINREDPRWLFFAGDFPGQVAAHTPAGGIDFGSPCIVPYIFKPGYMHRCLITPCIRVTQQLFKQEAPVGVTIVEALPGFHPITGERTDMVHIYIYPGEELDVLMRQYADWGLVEIVTLQGRKPEDVEELKLNTLFFPEWPVLPKTNKALIEHLRNRKTFFNKSQYKDVYHAIADEMIAGVQRTHRWMERHIAAVHAAFHLSERDTHKRSHYDWTDLHFIEMAGLKREDQAVKSLADSEIALMEVLGKQQSGMDSQTFMDALKTILTQNNEAIKEALARSAPTKEAQ